MAAVKRVFRAESLFREAAGAQGLPERSEEQRHRELMAEMASLRALMKGAPDPKEMSEHVLQEFRRELGEAAKLKKELDAMYEAILMTKKEIAALHHTTGSEGPEMTRVTNELDAIVIGTEGATEAILSASEFIDETANTLSARLSGQDRDMANDIQERVIQIFEACNFQDLTGQRISKVVGALRFVEERIIDMMNIWGGIEAFKEIEFKMRESNSEGDAALLNGPSLKSDTDTVSQDDIDALFA
ncbi:protein phosphatase CheZ [Pannonibacter sp. SL95]|jgi:chemotaxis protein CheZ|uniref:protein phosphatase CheZ n=1 Tax=Pannonibacter sp. SL95 TaxID=2995153 RepID=UPI002276E56A|nr:protein phosphatase CheZ [Pannonibacter sp. SL95]MCY1707972.1 protein phosphatase CheZ [Pannonibacter sp. SL95]